MLLHPLANSEPESALMEQKPAAAPSYEPVPAISSPSPSQVVAAGSTRRHRHHGKKDRKHRDRAHSPEPEQGDVDGYQQWPSIDSPGPLHSSEPLQLYQPALCDEPQVRRTVSEPVAGQRQKQYQVFSSSEPRPTDDVPDPGAAQYLSLAMAVAAFVLIVALQLAFAAPLPHQQKAPLAQLVPATCTSQLCHHYVKLFSEAMNTSASPCDSFYTYACGRWDASHLRNGESSVLVESWGRLAKRAATRLSMVPYPMGKAMPVHRASQYIYTCLAVIRVPRIPEIGELLAKGNITWPKRNDNADFLGALFYMARQLFLPIAFDVATSEAAGPEKTSSSKYVTLHLSQSRRFQEHVNALASLRRSGQLLGHLRLMYETLASSVNESRLKELASHYDYLDNFFRGYQKPAHYVTRSDNASFFLQYTPSVPKDRWDAVMRRYLNVSLLQDGGGNKLLGGVVIQDTDLFATFFEMHAKYGEFFAADVVGAMCVQTLAEYASFDILASLFRSPTVATQRIYDLCFSNAYMFYGHAINAYFHQPLSSEVVDLRLLAAVVHESFTDRGRTITMTSATNLGVNNASMRHPNFDLALSGLDKLNMKTLSGHYERYPNMTDSPVYDWIQHAAFASAGGLVATEGPVPVTINSDIRRNAGRFKNFRVSLAHMEEPFYAANVSAAVLMAGTGARLAAALFYDQIETGGGPDGTGGSTKVYAENHECLSPGTGTGSFPDLEFQGAVASVGVAWTAFQKALSGTHAAPHGGRRRLGTGGIGPLKEDELFFLFFCYLFCGNGDGERMCNAPLQHSPEFSRVFGCANASFMNPVKKCRVI